MKASFTPSSSSSGGSGIGSTMAGMSKIEMKIYQGIFDRYEIDKDFTSSFTTSSIHIENDSNISITMKNICDQEKGIAQKCRIVRERVLTPM